MTIGIAVTLNDGVLLIADGRRTRPLVAGQPPADDINKIFQLNSTVGAIIFGVAQATDVALASLRSTFSSSMSPDVIAGLAENSVNLGWHDLMRRIADDVDVAHRAIKVGLVLGGIANNQPFITGALKHIDGGNSVLETSEHKFIVLGGEEQNARAEFNARAERAVNQFGGLPGTTLMSDLVSGLLQSAADTIRFVGSRVPDVGGTIRFAVIRKGYPFTTEIFR